MDLRSLRYFVAVAEAQSVGKAALQLNMAQPPLSVQIRNLEARVGTALFHREATGMRLTDAGAALLSRARESLALAYEGFEAARAVAAGRRGRLTVGYMFALGYAVLPGLLPRLRERMPDVDLQFVEMSARTSEAMLLERRVTVALCMPPLVREGIESQRVGSQPLRLAARTRSPLARLKSVPLQRLEGERLISLPTYIEGAETSLVTSLLRRHQVNMPVAHRVETVHAALALVLAEEGVAFVPDCARLGAPAGLAFRPLQGARTGFDVSVCWRSDLRSPLIDPFLASVRAALAG